MGVIKLAFFAPIILVSFPVLIALFTNNSTFFEEAFKTFGNGFDIVISSFQLFVDIGSVLPGRIYPLYVLAIGLLVGMFAIALLHTVVQILATIGIFK